MVDEDAEVETVFDGLDIKSLLALLLVTASENLVERSQLVEDSQGGLTPEKQFFRLSLLHRVHHYRREPRSFHLFDLDALLKLSDALKGANEVEFLALVGLNCEGQATGNHDFVLTRNQEREVAPATHLRNCRTRHQFVFCRHVARRSIA